MSATTHMRNMFLRLLAELHERDPGWTTQKLIDFGFAAGDVRFCVPGAGHLRATVLRWPWERADGPRPMRPIPIAAAKDIAKSYGYDQVIVIARRVGAAPEPHGEHVTTYGVDRAHCDAAAQCGRALKRFMGWPAEPGSLPEEKL